MSNYSSRSERIVPVAKGFCKTHLTHRATLSLIDVVRQYPILWDQNKKYYGNQDWTLTIWNSVVVSMFYYGYPNTDFCISTWYNLVEAYFNHDKSPVDLSKNDLEYMEKMKEFMSNQDEKERIYNISKEDIQELPMVRKYFSPTGVPEVYPIQSQKIAPARPRPAMVEAVVQTSPKKTEAIPNLRNLSEKENVYEGPNCKQTETDNQNQMVAPKTVVPARRRAPLIEADVQTSPKKTETIPKLENFTERRDINDREVEIQTSPKKTLSKDNNSKNNIQSLLENIRKNRANSGEVSGIKRINISEDHSSTNSETPIFPSKTNIKPLFSLDKSEIPRGQQTLTEFMVKKKWNEPKDSSSISCEIPILPSKSIIKSLCALDKSEISSGQQTLNEFRVKRKGNDRKVSFSADTKTEFEDSPDPVSAPKTMEGCARPLRKTELIENIEEQKFEFSNTILMLAYVALVITLLFIRSVVI